MRDWHCDGAAEGSADEEDAWRQFLKRVEAYSTEFDITKSDAVRWIFGAEDVDLVDIDQFCYENRLAYSREAEIKEILNAGK